MCSYVDLLSVYVLCVSTDCYLYMLIIADLTNKTTPIIHS